VRSADTFNSFNPEPAARPATDDFNNGQLSLATKGHAEAEYRDRTTC